MSREISKFRARIEVKLKKHEFDPEAETINRSLKELDFPVSETRVSKIYEITLKAGSLKEAESITRLMCIRLLANPTKDEYSSEVVEISTSSAHPRT